MKKPKIDTTSVEPAVAPADFSKVANLFKKRKTTGGAISDLGGTLLTSGMGVQEGKKGSLLGL
jgi:hypothetical protein